MGIKGWYNQKKQKPWKSVDFGVKERTGQYLAREVLANSYSIMVKLTQVSFRMP
jgi:hypothetical protein